MQQSTSTVGGTLKGEGLRFVDLFAGIGGFHVALDSLGHKCVFASEIDPGLRDLYVLNHGLEEKKVAGDIRDVVANVPGHDVLTAGFPCQPFSKSGTQDGFQDQTRGTLFHQVLEIARRNRPDLVVLENVGNFAHHDGGRTWKIVRKSLERIGYCVRGTEPKSGGGHGLISPHQFGYPHHRERFFAIAARWDLPIDPFPIPTTMATRRVFERMVTSPSRLTKTEGLESRLTAQQVGCINHWNKLVRRLPADSALPSFPIWGDEINARYPYQDTTPYQLSLRRLRHAVGRGRTSAATTRDQLLRELPAYAQRPDKTFPMWKQNFITKNRNWFAGLNGTIDHEWTEALKGFPPSLRKLEWNCKGDDRDLWDCVLQFRPSGLRAKRYVSVPALVAMTVTQIPILGPERRYITRREGLRFQGLSEDTALPGSRSAAFTALGNAVHVDVAKAVVAAAIKTAPANYRWGVGTKP
jgi:DNA (cytosine-5)-methyltransferase 1